MEVKVGLNSCADVFQGGTYGGSVMGAAAACATLDVIKEEGLLENANERGAQLVKVGHLVTAQASSHKVFNHPIHAHHDIQYRR